MDKDTIFVSRGLLDKLCKANSCAELSNDKVRDIIRIKDKDYVVTGTVSSGKAGNISADAFECMLRTKYKGTIKPLYTIDHQLEVNAGLRERGYDGRLFNHKGKTFILCGPRITFKPFPEEKKSQKQLSLFK